ncbi:MAG TPA: HAMP domain-containing sensor histidine kinase [Chroococcidiopsis sp.]
MFQATRRRLALWYTGLTAVLLLLFATGFYWYVHNTLVERIDDTLNHVLEVVQRSLVIESPDLDTNTFSRLNLEASFRNNPEAVDDDHIDLEWFSPMGELVWSSLSQPLTIPLRLSDGETVHVSTEQVLRQVTKRIEVGRQVVGYLRVSHPWFEVTKPARQLVRDLTIGTSLMIGAIASIGWFLSGLAMAPVRDSYQRLKQFTADASHELRNPIAVIQTNVQVALSDPDPDAHEQQQQLKVIERLTRRLGRLVDDLLFLARQDSGITTRYSQTVALSDLLKDVIEEQGAIASDNQISLTLLPPSPAEGYAVQGDRDQLIRLFTNLIGNAVQYTPTGGTVSVTLQPTKAHSQCQISVCDTGVGIPEDALPHLFDRFYRVDPARSRVGASVARSPKNSEKSGSGLGLAIAKVITENHHGQIQVESTLGQGTTFMVTLPTLPASAQLGHDA